MSTPKMLGITGKLGSGKDQSFERLDVLYPGRFVRQSFAALLKQSLATLLDVSVDLLEEWKRSEEVGVQLVHEHRGGLDSPITIRTLMQRMGTEVGRDLYGSEFWVNQAMDATKEFPHGKIAVFTDVRFSNEAAAIIDRGGEVWKVVGPDEDTGDHASEQPIQTGYVDHWIRNTERDDNYSMLDSQIRQIVDTWEFEA